MHDTFSDGWRSDGRGFWTKRKKTATSLLSVLALVAGIAVAYKLFDRTVPNNVVRDAAVFGYEIFKREAALDGSTWVEAGADQPIFEAGPDQYPGDTRRVAVRIDNTNNPSRNASFLVHANNIEVLACQGLNEDTGECDGGYDPVDSTSGPGLRFLNFWTLRVDREDIFVSPAGEYRPGTFSTTCQGSLREINQANPCDLGMIRGASSTNGAPPPFNQPMDDRLYDFRLSETDDGTDQSDFKGWRVQFDLVFQARVPAAPQEGGPIGQR